MRKIVPVRDEVLVEVLGPDTFLYTGILGSPRARVVSVSPRCDAVKPGEIVLIPDSRPELEAGALTLVRERDLLGVVEEAARCSA